MPRRTPIRFSGDLHDPSYTPENFIEELLKFYKVKNRHNLALKTGISDCFYSRIWNRVEPLSCEMLLRLHDVTGIEIATLKSWAGLPQVKRLIYGKV